MLNEVPDDLSQIYGDNDIKREVAKFDKGISSHVKHGFMKICI